MAIFVTLDPNNLVKQVYSGQTGPGGSLLVVRPKSENEIPLPGTVHFMGKLDAKIIARMRLKSGYLEPRPISPNPYDDEGDIVVPPCPAGTKIVVYDLSGQEKMAEITADADDFTETFAFTDPGLYEIEVHAPLPYLPTKFRISV